MPEISETLKERGGRYGTFVSNSLTSQQLKKVLHAHPNWVNLTVDKKEALEMVAHKISRILNGDPEYADSWHDIAGYATLVEQEILGPTTATSEAEFQAALEAGFKSSLNPSLGKTSTLQKPTTKAQSFTPAEPDNHL